MRIRGGYIVAILMSVIIGGSILGYGYLGYRYKKEALEVKVKADEQARLEKEAKQKKLLQCLNDINNRVANIFEKYKGLDREDTKALSDIEKNEKDECFRLNQ